MPVISADAAVDEADAAADEVADEAADEAADIRQCTTVSIRYDRALHGASYIDLVVMCSVRLLIHLKCSYRQV